MTALLVFVAQILPSRLNIWQIAIVSIVASATMIARHFVEWDSVFYHILSFSSFPIVFIMAVFYKGKLWRRLAILFYFAAIMALSDVLVGFALMSVLDMEIADLVSNRATIMGVLGGVATLAVYIILGSLTVLVWRSISTRRFQPFFLLFFIFPVGQFIMLLSIVFTTWTTVWLFGILVSLVANLMLLVYTISLDKKTALEEELRETRHVMELEHSHYREIELRREELAKIRHDFNNQLATIGRLIHAGEESSAKNMISALSEEIADTKENPFCNIPVINAVISEKANICTAYGINLIVDLNIPDSLSVEEMRLCSIFSNLLDNAINSCKQNPQENTTTITLQSIIDGDYLFMKVVNPSGEPPVKAKPDRGYGIRIISDLTARYGGDYQMDYHDGMYTAIVSLLAV